MPVPYLFNNLTLDERMERVNEEGSFIASDPSGPSNFYELWGFYVEVVLDKATSKIIDVRAFSDGEHRDRMIACMDMPV